MTDSRSNLSTYLVPGRTASPRTLWRKALFWAALPALLLLPAASTADTTGASSERASSERPSSEKTSEAELSDDLEPATSNRDVERSQQYMGPEGKVLPFSNDTEVLAFLHTADIVKEKRLDSGINKPLRVTLEKDGVRARAIFRTVENTLGPADDGRPNPHRARDSYIFEVAAYKVSRALGLDRVPPVVLRKYKGKRGSLQLWVEDAMTEASLLQSDRATIRPARRQVQKEVMRVFDQLVYNWDRHQGNSLYDTFGSLWYIDHTRTFKALNHSEGIQRIAVCDDQLYAGLKALDKKEMRKELAPYLSLMQIDAMMRRRDKIVRQIDTMIEQRGRHAVLFDVEQRTKTSIRSASTVIEDALKPTTAPGI